MAGPLKELPKEAVREYLRKNQAVLSELHRAASMKDSEYAIGLDSMPGADSLGILLNEIQNARDLARLLVLDVRLARSEHKYDDAIRSLRAGFRLAESVGQATDLVMGRLVGIAIAGLMLHEVQELIAQEESPNMYWALASLPSTIWELRQVFEFETNLAGRFFPQLEAVTRSSSLSDAAWQERLIDSASEFLKLAGRVEDEEQGIIDARLMAGALVLVFDGTARVYLERVGYAPEEVRAMSPSEAVLRSTREQLRRIQDAYLKWTLLPHRLAGEYGIQEELSLQPEGNLTDPAAIMVSLLLPAIRAAQDAALRTEQSVAFLATVEALRMYAAEQGRFPDSLDHLQPVPAFPDPATGTHFQYERISDAEARLERSEVRPGQPETKFRLELRE